MNILHMVKGLSAAECREMGETLIEFSENHDDPKWHAALDEAIALNETPEGRGMAQQLRDARVSAGLPVLNADRP